MDAVEVITPEAETRLLASDTVGETEMLITEVGAGVPVGTEEDRATLLVADTETVSTISEVVALL